MFRAFSILYCLILFVLLSKKRNLSLCCIRMNHMRDSGYTLEVYDKVRQDPNGNNKKGKPYEKGEIIIYKGTQQ